MNVNEAIKLRGEVIITSIDADGNTKLLVKDNNLIVNNGRNLLAQGLVSDTSTYVSNIVFGTGGTLPSDPSSPLSVTPGELAVNNPVTTSPLLDRDYTFTYSIVSNSTVSFTINLPMITVNGSGVNALDGQGINEMALMFTNNTAFAIKRFATITKSASIAINIVWSVYF